MSSILCKVFINILNIYFTIKVLIIWWQFLFFSVQLLFTQSSLYPLTGGFLFNYNSMNSKTIIKSIMVVPYSTVSCTYYINDGERHATTYDKVNELLTNLVPTLCYDILQKMNRRLPFYIDVVKKELYSIDYDKIMERNTLKSETLGLTQINIRAYMEDQKKEETLYQRAKEKIINTFFKK